jgi:murein L,D-transpeptidase YafK
MPVRKIFFLFLSIVILFIAATAAWYFYPEKKLPAGTRIDRLVVYKERRVMEAYAGSTLVKEYTISLGREPRGAKQREGDKRTPEGHYVINTRNANSGYHKNLGISYPNAADRRRARQQGVAPGGNVKIHGLKNGKGYIGKFQRLRDWTAGCIAVTDEEVDELFVHVVPNARIIIYP